MLCDCFSTLQVRADLPKEYGINLMACFFLVHHHGGRIRADSGRRARHRVHPAAAGRSGAAGQELTIRSSWRKSVLNQNLWEKLLSS